MSPLPDLDGLTWLFECEPQPWVPTETEWRSHWPYGAVTFSLIRGSEAATVSIAPAEQWVLINVRRGEFQVIDLALGRVQSISVEKLHGLEFLHVEFSDPLIETLVLQTRPEFSIVWSVLKEL